MEESMESSRSNGEPMEKNKPTPGKMDHGDNVLAVVKGLLWSIFFPEPISDLSGTSFFYRAKTCLRRDFPRLRESSKSAGMDILSWTRRGSPLRALLVLSVGAISLLTLTGVSVFMLFFLTATINAVVISLLVSLAAAGGALAIFFSCVAAIYIGALAIAVFVISVSTISAIIAVLITAGWVGFLWTIWLALSKSASLAKHSIGITGSAISAYSARHSHRHEHHNHHG
ncbi:hypothetical protein V2J09_003556 [Rumex salicifolius]